MPGMFPASAPTTISTSATGIIDADADDRREEGHARARSPPRSKCSSLLLSVVVSRRSMVGSRQDAVLAEAISPVGGSGRWPTGASSGFH